MVSQYPIVDTVTNALATGPTDLAMNRADAVTTSPDAEMKVYGVALENNTPPALLQNESTENLNRMSAGSIDYDTMQRENPAMAKLYDDVHSATVAQDEHEALLEVAKKTSFFEKSKRFASGLGALAPGLESGYIQGVTARRARALEALDTEQEALDRVKAGELDFESFSARFAPQEQTGSTTALLAGAPGEINTAAAPRNAEEWQADINARAVTLGAQFKNASSYSPFFGAPESLRAFQQAKGLRQTLDAVTTEVTGYMIGQGIAQDPATTALATLLAPYTGPAPLLARTAIGAKSNFDLNYNLTLAEEILKSGVDVTDPRALRAFFAAERTKTQQAGGTAKGAVDAGINALASLAASRMRVGGALAIGATSGMAGEAGGNVAAQQTGAEGFENTAVNIIGEGLADSVFTALEAYNAAVSNIGTNTPDIRAYNAVMSRMQTLGGKALASMDFGAAIDEFTSAFSQLKTLQRDPTVAHKFAEDLTDQGAPKDLFLDPQALQQANVDIQELAKLSPTFAARVGEAVATGGTVQMPFSEYVTLVAPTMGNKLNDHVRAEPDGFSRAEAEEFMRVQSELVKTEAANVVAEAKIKEPFEASTNAVEENIFNQLKTTGRFTDTVNRFYARLTASAFAVNGARVGLNAEQFFNEFGGLNIVADTDASPAVFTQTYKGMELDTDGMLQITHFSATAGITKLDPDQWGLTGAALPRSERNRRGVVPNRTYAYLGSDFKKENQLGDIRYTGKIDPNKYYDLGADPLNLKQRGAAISNERGFNDVVAGIKLAVQEAGFDGYIAKAPQGGYALVSYKPLDVTQAPSAIDLQATPADFTADGIRNILQKTDWVIMTPENPNAVKATDEENAKFRQEFEDHLRHEGIAFTGPMDGSYGSPKRSYALTGVGAEQARQLGTLFNQESVVVPAGLLYQDGTVNPARGVNVFDTRPEDFYTVLPDGTIFSIDINFDVREGGVYNQSAADTAAFKQWFGDSKVVDANGAPKKMYHATDKNNAIGFVEDFSAFLPLSHFGTSSAANERLTTSSVAGQVKLENARILPVYLKISNPLRIDDNNGDASIEYYVTELENRDIISAREADNILAARDSDARDAIVRAMEAAGYDGFVYENTVEDAGSDSYIVLRPTQVKSVFNRGTFDSSNSDLLFQRAVLASKTPGWKKWFGKSKALTPEGVPVVVYHGTMEDVEAFDRTKTGGRTGARDAKNAFFFVSRGETASTYAEETSPYADGVLGRINRATGGIYERLSERMLSLFGMSAIRSGGNVIPLHLRIEHPFEVDYAGRSYDERDFTQFIDAARARGHDGVIIRNVVDEGFVEGDGVPSDVYVTFEPDQAKSIFNINPTRDPRLLHQRATEPRGTFNPKTNTIALLKAANLSTFLHESGHLFLEMLAFGAAHPNAQADIKADMDATLKWMGVSDITGDRLQVWNTLTLEQKRPFHEKFARGFESYLFEGKSPSVGMADVFRRVKAWLTRVYRDAVNLNVELDPEIRGVFDRMLASSDQIQEAENMRAYEGIFDTAEEAGMPDAAFREYLALQTTSTQEALEELQKRSLRDMQWMSNAKSRELKKLQKRNVAKRREVREEVRAELMTQPAYQAIKFFKTGQYEAPVGASKEVRDAYLETSVQNHKLSLPVLKETYGEEGNAIWRFLQSGKYGFVAQEGMHPDAAATMFGYDSGDAMIRDILATPDFNETLEGMTDQRMLEQYGDLIDQRAMERAADKAIHNEARAKVIATEMNALQKAAGKSRIMASMAKAYADDAIGKLLVREVRPGQYARQEAKAARESSEAFRKGDIETAAIKKRAQLLQNYSAKAAYDALDDVEKAIRYFKKFDKTSIVKKVSPEYVDQIRQLLDRYELTTTTLKALDKRKSLREFVAAQQELGLEPNIPQELIDEVSRKNYREATVDELRGLYDTIKQIEHLGRLKNKLLTAKDQRDFDTTVDQIVTNIREKGPKRTLDNSTKASNWEATKLNFKGYLAMHRKVASIGRQLDGFEDGGIFWDTFIRTMNDAGAKEAKMREETTAKLLEIIQPLLSGRPFADAFGSKKEFFPTIGRSLNREERMVIALNTGNAGNLQRLLDGEGWEAAQLTPILDSLTKEEWDAIQSIRDLFESFRPQIAAKEKRVYGIEPHWVEPTPVITPHGEYRGGYYPIKYDGRRNDKAAAFNEAEEAKAMLKGAFLSATTRRSFTKTRSDEVKGRPLLYTMDGLYSGLNDVIHDLTWHEWVIDMNRMLRDGRISSAVRDIYGDPILKQIKSGVRDIAGGDAMPADPFERVLADLRAGATVAGLGFNLVNSLINVTGITQSISRIGARWMLVGLREMSTRPRSLVEEVHARSDMMRTRMRTRGREINEIQSRIRGKSTAREKVDNLMFAPMYLTQMAVDTPTWWGAYQKNLLEFGDEEKAAALADQAVLDAQSGGQVKDLAAIQRGSAYMKLFTTFYGYFSGTYNLAVEKTRKTNFSNPGDVVRLGGDYLLLAVVPAVLTTLIKTAIQGDDEDWELDKLATKMSAESAGFALGTLVGVREFGGVIQMLTGTNYGTSGYGGPAGLRFFSEIYKLANQVSQGEADSALMKAFINVVGVIFKLPSAQINRSLTGIGALIEGETDNPLAIIGGPPPK